jgi:Lon protease-like protein
VQAIPLQSHTGDKKQALHNLFAAYLHTVPLEELIESVERARRDAQLRYVVIYGAACSYCLARAEWLEGSYLRTFALELKEQLAQTLAAFVTSILVGPHRRPDAEEAAEPPLRQIIEVLQQVMCTHDAEKLAISVLEIYEDGGKKNED